MKVQEWKGTGSTNPLKQQVKRMKVIDDLKKIEEFSKLLKMNQVRLMT